MSPTESDMVDFDDLTEFEAAKHIPAGGSDLHEDPEVAAKKLGKIVVHPAFDELLIDIDSEEGHAALLAGIATAASCGITIAVVKKIPSATPGHFHVYCTVELDGTCYDELTPELRIALQACLGSDLRREFFSLARVMLKTDRPPTVFFENP